MNNAIIYWKKDREDGWIMGGFVFRVRHTQTFEGAYNELKPKFENPEFIEWLIEEHCLIDDLFDGDKTYRFSGTLYNGGLEYVFENSEGYERTLELEQEFVYLPE